MRSHSRSEAAGAGREVDISAEAVEPTAPAEVAAVAVMIGPAASTRLRHPPNPTTVAMVGPAGMTWRTRTVRRRLRLTGSYLGTTNMEIPGHRLWCVCNKRVRRIQRAARAGRAHRRQRRHRSQNCCHYRQSEAIRCTRRSFLTPQYTVADRHNCLPGRNRTRTLDSDPNIRPNFVHTRRQSTTPRPLACSGHKPPSKSWQRSCSPTLHRPSRW